MRLIAMLLALLLAVPAAAQTPEERTRLDWAQARGRLLFEVDRAAWVTTDDLQERLSQADQRRVRGWTVERDGTGFAVNYFMMGEDNVLRALYRARVENRRVVSRETFRPSAGPELTPMQRRIADAYRLITQTDIRICSERPNLAVIQPDSLEAPMDVYVLTSQTRPGIFPFGGHSRATVSAAGALLSQRRFTNTCLDLSNTPPEGSSEVAGLVVTHLLDPVPTEIHVFLSIWMEMPVFVSTGEPHRVWEVTGNRIELVEPSPAAPRT
jgi:hypothetical protein